MNARSLASLCALSAGLSLLAGCVAPAGAPEEAKIDSKVTTDYTITTANWFPLHNGYGVITGSDVGGTPLYSCRAYDPSIGAVVPGKTRKDWSSCNVSWGGKEYWETQYDTMGILLTEESNGGIPPQAIALGTVGGKPVYSCSASYVNDSTQVGVTGAGIAGCEITYAGATTTIASDWVLTGPGAYFGMTTQAVGYGSPLPYNAQQTGVDSDGAALYPCTVSYAGGTYVGKTRASWGSCDIAYGGAEVHPTSSYAVLVPQFVAPGNPDWYAVATDTDGSTQGICNASYLGTSLQVGKYTPAGATLGARCDFPYGSTEVELFSGFSVFGGAPLL